MRRTAELRKEGEGGREADRGRFLVALVFLIFLIPRIFVSSPVYFVGLDEAKYLALAKSFPAHALFNDQFYVVHPPLFPAAIRLFSFVLPDHVSGILVSLLSALAAFALTAGIFRLFGKDWRWVAVALLPLAVSPLHIPTSRVIYKDSLFFALFLASLCCYLRGLAGGPRAAYPLAAAAAALCALTSDLAAYLSLAFLLAWFLLPRARGRGRGPLLPPLALLLVQSAWIGVRWRIFSQNEFYPAGVDGLIERVGGSSVRSLLAPRYLPQTVRLFDFRLDLARLGLHNNVYPLEGLADFPSALYVVFYIFCALSALAILCSPRRIVGATFLSRSEPRRACGSDIPVAIRAGSGQECPSHIEENVTSRRSGLFFSFLLVVYSLPGLLHPEPRFLMPVLLPLGYLFAAGMERLAGKRMRVAAPVLIVPLLIASISWLDGHRPFALAVRKEVESARTAAYLETLPEGGIMAQVGYPPELAYLTGRRVIALPLEPADLDRFIARYGIRYLVYGQRYWAPVDPRFARSVWCWETIQHIRAHPEKYPLLRIVGEDYGGGERSDRVFIHSVSLGPILPDRPERNGRGPS